MYLGTSNVSKTTFGQHLISVDMVSDPVTLIYEPKLKMTVLYRIVLEQCITSAQVTVFSVPYQDLHLLKVITFHTFVHGSVLLCTT